MQKNLHFGSFASCQDPWSTGAIQTSNDPTGNVANVPMFGSVGLAATTHNLSPC